MSSPFSGTISPRMMRGLVRQAAPVLWGGLALNLLALAVPLFSMLVYDKLIGNDVHETLWAMVAGMLMVMTLEFVLRMARSYVLEFTGAQWDRALDQRIQRGIFALGLDRNLSLGALFGTLREISSRRDLFTASALLPLMDVPFLLIYLIGVAILGTWIVCVPLFIGFGVIAAQLSLQVVVESLTRRAAAYQKERIDMLHGLAVSRATLAGSIRREEFARQLSAQSLMTSRASARLQFWLQILAAIVPAASTATTVFVLVVGVYMVEAQWMSTGQLIAASLLATRAVGAFLSIQPTWSRLKELNTALMDLAGLLQMEVREGATLLHSPVVRVPDIACKDLDYLYPKATRPSLSKLNFALEAGQMLAVVGKVGCGKSSLLRILAGHFVPSAGQLSVGDLSIRNEMDAQHLQYNVAFAEQFPLLLQGTVQTYLLAEHDTDAAREKAIQTVVQLHLDQALRSSGMGLNSEIHPGGHNLSGGQRRLVAVMRALTMGRSLIVLDEPTAGLDAQAEKIVLEAMAALAGKATVVVASHSAAMVAMADTVLVLESGAVSGWMAQPQPVRPTPSQGPSPTQEAPAAQGGAQSEGGPPT